MPNPHAGHRKRMREEFQKNGADHMADHKLLELFLFYAIPRADTNEIAHALIDRFGSFSSIFDAPLELLTDAPGIGKSSAVLIKTVSAVIKRYMDDYTTLHNTILTVEDAKEYMRYKFLCEASECVYMACIGANGKVLYCDVIAEGNPETVFLRPSDVIRKALVSNAVRVVLAHNHPNGICNPSNKDVQATSILYDELRRVDIELFDHIIVASDGVCSLKEIGMFPHSFPR